MDWKSFLDIKEGLRMAKETQIGLRCTNEYKKEVKEFIDEVNIPMDMFFIFDYGYRQLRKKYSSDFEKLQKLEQEIGSVENNLSEMCVERDKLKRKIERYERRNKIILDENTLNSFKEVKKDFEEFKAKYSDEKPLEAVLHDYLDKYPSFIRGIMLEHKLIELELDVYIKGFRDWYLQNH